MREIFLPEIRTALENLDARPFAPVQIFRSLHRRCAHDFATMSDLPGALRKKLAADFTIATVTLASRQRSKDGTVKLLLKLHDGLKIETVFLTEGRRRTQCVSTQVGCALGCTFCATAALGFERNLTAGEIVAQVEDSQSREGRAANLVFMGMGEPFLNYENVLRAIRILNHKDGANIGARRMTVSTAGLPEGIRRFAREKLQVRLALSLNATTDKQRSRLMPVNRKHPLAEVLDALRHYVDTTGRRATIEYVLIPGENDSDGDLRRLTKIARSVKVNVNLIEMNPGARKAVYPVGGGQAPRWKRALLEAGVEAVIRFRRGTDIHAGCGQLALRVKNG